MALHVGEVVRKGVGLEQVHHRVGVGSPRRDHPGSFTAVERAAERCVRRHERHLRRAAQRARRRIGRLHGEHAREPFAEPRRQRAGVHVHPADRRIDERAEHTIEVERAEDRVSVDEDEILVALAAANVEARRVVVACRDAGQHLHGAQHVGLDEHRRGAGLASGERHFSDVGLEVELLTLDALRTGADGRQRHRRRRVAGARLRAGAHDRQRRDDDLPLARHAHAKPALARDLEQRGRRRARVRADRERRAQLGKLRIERDVELRLVRDGLERVARALAREADADRRAQRRHAISIRPQVGERRRVRPRHLRARNRGQSVAARATAALVGSWLRRKNGDDVARALVSHGERGSDRVEHAGQRRSVVPGAQAPPRQLLVGNANLDVEPPAQLRGHGAEGHVVEHEAGRGPTP